MIPNSHYPKSIHWDGCPDNKAIETNLANTPAEQTIVNMDRLVETTKSVLRKKFNAFSAKEGNEKFRYQVGHSINNFYPYDVLLDVETWLEESTASTS